MNPELRSPITYPARPLNGGPFPKALPKSGDWFYEAKYNGWRALIHIATGTMFNRKGQPLTISGEFQTALDQIRLVLDAEAFKWADCEALERRHGIGRGTLIVLDVVPEPAFALATYTERREWLRIGSLPTLYSKPSPESLYKSCQIAPQYAEEMWAELRRLNTRWGCDFYEGLVAKRADSVYPIQLRNPDSEFPFWIKHRWAW
jgi:ATP-dependent DNA ligase